MNGQWIETWQIVLFNLIFFAIIIINSINKRLKKLEAVILQKSVEEKKE